MFFVVMLLGIVCLLLSQGKEQKNAGSLSTEKEISREKRLGFLYDYSFIVP